MSDKTAPIQITDKWIGGMTSKQAKDLIGEAYFYEGKDGTLRQYCWFSCKYPWLYQKIRTFTCRFKWALTHRLQIANDKLLKQKIIDCARTPDLTDDQKMVLKGLAKQWLLHCGKDKRLIEIAKEGQLETKNKVKALYDALKKDFDELAKKAEPTEEEITVVENNPTTIDKETSVDKLIQNDGQELIELKEILKKKEQQFKTAEQSLKKQITAGKEKSVQIELLTKEVENLNGTIRDLKTEIKTLKEQIESQKNQLNSAKQPITKNEQPSVKQSGGDKNGLGKLQVELSEAERKLKESEQKVENHLKTIKEKSSEIELLVNQIEKQKITILDLEKQLKTMTETKELLVKDHELFKQKVTKEYEPLTSKNQKLESDLKQKVSAFDDLEKKYKVLQKEKEDSLRPLKDGVTLTAGDAKFFKNRYIQENEKNTQHEKEINQLKDYVKKLSEVEKGMLENKAMVKENTELKQKNITLSNDLEKQKGQISLINELGGTNSILSTEVNKLKKVIEEASKREEKYKIELTQYKDRIILLEKKAETLNAENLRLKNRSNRSHGQLNSGNITKKNLTELFEEEEKENPVLEVIQNDIDSPSPIKKEGMQSGCVTPTRQESLEDEVARLEQQVEQQELLELDKKIVEMELKELDTKIEDLQAEIDNAEEVNKVDLADIALVKELLELETTAEGRDQYSKELEVLNEKMKSFFALVKRMSILEDEFSKLIAKREQLNAPRDNQVAKELVFTPTKQCISKSKGSPLKYQSYKSPINKLRSPFAEKVYAQSPKDQVDSPNFFMDLMEEAGWNETLSLPETSGKIEDKKVAEKPKMPEILLREIEKKAKLRLEIKETPRKSVSKPTSVVEAFIENLHKNALLEDPVDLRGGWFGGLSESMEVAVAYDKRASELNLKLEKRRVEHERLVSLKTEDPNEKNTFEVDKVQAYIIKLEVEAKAIKTISRLEVLKVQGKGKWDYTEVKQCVLDYDSKYKDIMNILDYLVDLIGREVNVLQAKLPKAPTSKEYKVRNEYKIELSQEKNQKILQEIAVLQNELLLLKEDICEATVRLKYWSPFVSVLEEKETPVEQKPIILEEKSEPKKDAPVLSEEERIRQEKIFQEYLTQQKATMEDIRKQIIKKRMAIDKGEVQSPQQNEKK